MIDLNWEKVLRDYVTAWKLTGDGLSRLTVSVGAVLEEIDTYRARLTWRSDSAPVNRPFLAQRDKANGCGKEVWVVRWDDGNGCFLSVPGGCYVVRVTEWMDIPKEGA